MLLFSLVKCHLPLSICFFPLSKKMMFCCPSMPSYQALSQRLQKDLGVLPELTKSLLLGVMDCVYSVLCLSLYTYYYMFMSNLVARMKELNPLGDVVGHS